MISLGREPQERSGDGFKLAKVALVDVDPMPDE